jgi:hypothetical protein
VLITTEEKAVRCRLEYISEAAVWYTQEMAMEGLTSDIRLSL